MQRAANTLPVQPLALTDAPNTFWSMESGASPREGERVGILTRLSDGREYPLGVGNVRIGREQSEDLVVKDRTVSRHHADLTYESGRYVLYDQSSNGTWVNGNIVVAQPLEVKQYLGDHIANGLKRVTGGRVKPCSGCKKRREALNSIHRKAQELIHGR